MIEPEPVPQKKNNTWIWIVLGLVVLCLCCLVLLIVAGGYAIWKGYIPLSGIDIPNITSPSILATPTLIPAPVAPTEAPAQILVEPYLPQVGDDYPALQGLVSNYQGSSVPGIQTWNLTVNTNQSTLIYMGWCTTTETVLDQNFQHIQYLVEVDGRAIDAGNLYTLYEQDSTLNGYCKSYAGLIRTWPTGKHTIKIIMRMDAQINDGWSDYPAGDYTDIYNITVIP